MFITLMYARDCGGSRRARLRGTDEFMNGSTALQNCILVTTLSFPYKKNLLIWITNLKFVEYGQDSVVVYLWLANTFLLFYN